MTYLRLIPATALILMAISLNMALAQNRGPDERRPLGEALRTVIDPTTTEDALAYAVSYIEGHFTDGIAESLLAEMPPTDETVREFSFLDTIATTQGLSLTVRTRAFRRLATWLDAFIDFVNSATSGGVYETWELGSSGFSLPFRKGFDRDSFFQSVLQLIDRIEAGTYDHLMSYRPREISTVLLIRLINERSNNLFLIIDALAELLHIAKNRESPQQAQAAMEIRRVLENGMFDELSNQQGMAAQIGWHLISEEGARHGRAVVAKALKFTGVAINPNPTMEQLDQVRQRRMNHTLAKLERLTPNNLDESGIDMTPVRQKRVVQLRVVIALRLLSDVTERSDDPMERLIVGGIIRATSCDFLTPVIAGLEAEPSWTARHPDLIRRADILRRLYEYTEDSWEETAGVMFPRKVDEDSGREFWDRDYREIRFIQARGIDVCMDEVFSDTEISSAYEPLSALELRKALRIPLATLYRLAADPNFGESDPFVIALRQALRVITLSRRGRELLPELDPHAALSESVDRASAGSEAVAAFTQGSLTGMIALAEGMEGVVDLNPNFVDTLTALKALRPQFPEITRPLNTLEAVLRVRGLLAP